jgi:BirA family transcriptional regulator, biotin operon repressor / biotin---[acetyl-CoA-carboxylase] ligase
MPSDDPTPQTDPVALSRRSLTSAALPADGMWRAIEAVERTGSTNADLLTRATGRTRTPEGLVLVAEEQTAGRGRMGRTWVAPPHAALTFSVLLRPSWVPSGRLGWLSLLAGVSVCVALRSVAGVEAGLKWPNDVLAGGRKLAGILAEASGDTVVIGIGVNVSTGPAELPEPGPGSLPATSVYAEGLRTGRPVVLDRVQLLSGILLAFERRCIAWRNDHGKVHAIRAEYRELCTTVGREVRVEQPGGQVLSGKAVDVDPDGRLVVLVPSPPPGRSARVAVAAGDVIHVR